jgi:hypothetical protein
MLYLLHLYTIWQCQTLKWIAVFKLKEALAISRVAPPLHPALNINTCRRGTSIGPASDQARRLRASHCPVEWFSHVHSRA